MRLSIGPENTDRAREIEANGLKYRMVASDPHSMIKATCITKNKNVDGVFTSFVEAERACRVHASKLVEKKDNK